ncbi:MAG: cysteine dioxygenase family protein, partial [Thermomicrobiales bacterium]|nr:cysteine dioxygenase family protein [Thermomicrobiales bacterium]
MREFINKVDEIRGSTSETAAIVTWIEPHLAELMRDPDWLPAEFMEPKEDSGMGSGIGMWLLYRAGDGSLAFSSLVVPPGAATPVHDHLAWGLVGLYRGNQDEEVFTRTDDGSVDDFAKLETQVRRSLVPGDMYELLPETDIHQVRTTSEVTSVSLHLLGNDNGCIWRHQYVPEEERVQPFKSGWLNVPCNENEEEASAALAAS